MLDDFKVIVIEILHILNVIYYLPVAQLMQMLSGCKPSGIGKDILRG